MSAWNHTWKHKNGSENPQDWSNSFGPTLRSQSHDSSNIGVNIMLQQGDSGYGLSRVHPKLDRGRKFGRATKGQKCSVGVVVVLFFGLVGLTLLGNHYHEKGGQELSEREELYVNQNSNAQDYARDETNQNIRKYGSTETLHQSDERKSGHISVHSGGIWYSKVLGFGQGSMGSGQDSRYWDRDDRRRDDEYDKKDLGISTKDVRASFKPKRIDQGDDDEDNLESSFNVDRNSRLEKANMDKNEEATHNEDWDKHNASAGKLKEQDFGNGSLYNEHGRDELKIYEERYEVDLKEHGIHNTAKGDGLLNVDYSSNIREDIAENSSSPADSSKNFSQIQKFKQVAMEDDYQERSQYFFGNEKRTNISEDSSWNLDAQKRNTNSSRSKHRKHPNIPCEIAFLNSTDGLQEPEENPKFAKFLLEYVQREEKSDGVDVWEPKFAGHQSLEERENSFYARDQKLHCGFVKGPEGSLSTGFDLYEEDAEFLSTCHIAVSSCIFGNFDNIRTPTKKKVSQISQKNVCFVMFVDEKTLEMLSLEGRMLDGNGHIGLWKVVVVRNLPYMDMRRTGKIPKFLAHRLFPSARYSIWIDSKMRLHSDPLLILEYFLWRNGFEYAISNHYDRHCVWEEVIQNKRLNKFNHTVIDEQFAVYQADGLTKFNASDPNKLLPSNVPEGSFIVRAHTPMSNLFSCLWFNEVDRFTSRDQLSFAYIFLKLKRMNPETNFWLNMFKDCERRFMSKLFHHKAEETLRHLKG